MYYMHQITLADLNKLNKTSLNVVHKISKTNKQTVVPRPVTNKISISADSKGTDRFKLNCHVSHVVWTS